MRLDLPPQQFQYDLHYLEEARIFFEVTGQYIINPRHIYAQSLHLVDRNWRENFNRYLATLKYYEDYDKRPPEMR